MSGRARFKLSSPCSKSLPLFLPHETTVSSRQGQSTGRRVRPGEGAGKGRLAHRHRKSSWEPRDTGSDIRYGTSLETSRWRRKGTWTRGRLVPSTLTRQVTAGSRGAGSGLREGLRVERPNGQKGTSVKNQNAHSLGWTPFPTTASSDLRDK